MSEQLRIAGGCHCGSLRYELSWPGAAADAGKIKIPARRCSCSFCTRIDGVWTSHPEAALTISEDPDRPATRYRFSTETANFLFCSQCGITSLATSEVDGRCYAVVNVNTFDDDDQAVYGLEFSDTCFDGEQVEDRLRRRMARWIGRVEWLRR